MLTHRWLVAKEPTAEIMGPTSAITFTQHVAFDIRVIGVLTGALRTVISVFGGIHRAIQETRNISTADHTAFVSDLQSRTRLQEIKRAIE